MYLIAAREKFKILKNVLDYQGAWPNLKYTVSKVSKGFHRVCSIESRNFTYCTIYSHRYLKINCHHREDFLSQIDLQSHIPLSQ